MTTTTHADFFTSLGSSSLQVSRICLGTMTFGEQVSEPLAYRLLDQALAEGINFLDTAELYAVPPRRETYGATETIIGNWFAKRPDARKKVILATKVAGPSRGMDWIRGGSADLRKADILQACDNSLRRLQTDVIDLYQIHWPVRNAPVFGSLYFDPKHEYQAAPIEEQLAAMQTLIEGGKVRYVGLSNETPWGVMKFAELAERHGLPQVVAVQNPYALVNRTVDNGLDEVLFRSGIGLLAYSPLGFGTLTGKYDESGADPRQPNLGRLAKFEAVRRQRWARPEALTAARQYNALARDHGLTPTQLALAFCYQNWRVASTIIGVTTQEQLKEDIAAWQVKLSPQILTEIDQIRWKHRDPAQ